MRHNPHPLRAYLEQTHTNQATFAARVGTTQAHLSRVLSGKRVPSLSLALRIAAEAQIPVASLGVDRTV